MNTNLVIYKRPNQPESEMYRNDTVTELYTPEGWDKMTWEERVAAFLKSEDTPQRFDWPFPMAVFGTLREHQGNNHLMHRVAIEKVRAAFLPHFYCRSLGIYYRENACAPFDVFYYKPEEWTKMLYRVDCLEGWGKEAWARRNKQSGGYYRTLAWLRLLPEGYTDKFFKVGKGCDIWGERDMQIDSSKWGEYDRVPCWIYSSLVQNKMSDNKQDGTKGPSSHIIWPVPTGEDKVEF